MAASMYIFMYFKVNCVEPDTEDVLFYAEISKESLVKLFIRY